MTDLTFNEADKLGKEIRKSPDLMVGEFAAELIGEGYPLSKERLEIAFNGFTDEQLGIKFVQWWFDRNESRKVLNDA